MKLYKNAWFKGFSKKENISRKMLLKAIEQVEKGLVDADLGHGVIKQRIARAGQGKSGGYRTIILYVRGGKAFFVYGFAKSHRDNIGEEEKAAFKELAEHVLSLSDTQITQLIANNQFFEV